MKFSLSRFLVLSLSSVLLSLALPASAQFTQGPNCKSALTPTDVFMVPGITTTNIPAALQVQFSVGRSGLGFGCNIAGTNSATTTNTIIIIELSANGTEYAANNLVNIGVTPSGTGYSPFYTNIVSTSPNLDNVIFARIKSIQNTNIASIFITNTCFNTR